MDIGIKAANGYLNTHYMKVAVGSFSGVRDRWRTLTTSWRATLAEPPPAERSIAGVGARKYLVRFGYEIK